MATVGIVFFSGTGNTWRIAMSYCRAFAARGLEAALVPMEDLMRGDDCALLDHYDLLGIGYPIHAWNAPRLVSEFMSRLPRSEGQQVFLFVTAAYNVSGAFDWARAKLTRLGYDLIHESRYYTGSYYLQPAFRRMSDADITNRFTWCGQDVQEAVAEMTTGTRRRVDASDGSRFVLSTLLWNAYLLACRRLRSFLYADARCDQCGLCVQTCPTDNISLIGTGVTLGTNCTACLRCLSVCPQEAIQIARLTESIGRYTAQGYLDAVSARREEDKGVTCPGPPARAVIEPQPKQ